MRLNPDCVRGILLFVEDNTDFKHTVSISYREITPGLENYSLDEILYHVRQCFDSGLLERARGTTASMTIKDLTPSGHAFIANIRENSNWNQTKEIAKKVGTSSLDMFQQIASNVISTLITNNFK